MPVNIGGFARNFRVDGPDGKPWLVLSNSLAADLSMWDPQAERLAARFRVLRYDTRGHGLSETPPGPYELRDLVQDVVDLLDHVGIERASFMGLSLGGMTGLGLALDHPARVERLICCDARADAPEAYVKGWTDRIAMVAKSGTQAIATATVERWLSARTRAARPELVRRLEEMIAATSDVGYMGCAGALQRLDYRSRLPSIACPTLFIVGALDGATPPEVMADMAERVPRAKFSIVPEAAHISNLDNIPDFDAVADAFLDATVQA
ncbi:3-oxoadipate enol-lactonase [Acidisoma sp.]|uniref:3-oxoadipate enol-lactonase n=1 Tax=Acidisoma sp. TaxID=1872115 RepID=UPI003B00CA71